MLMEKPISLLKVMKDADKIKSHAEHLCLHCINSQLI